MKVIAILLISVLLFASCSDKPVQHKEAPPQLPVSKLSVSEATTYQEYPATIEGAVNVEIRPQVEGILEKILVDEGAYVTRGQPLFQIDPSPFKERLVNARASVLAAQGAIANARLEVEKLTPLVQNKVISNYQLKAANAAVQVADGNLSQAKAQVGSAKIDLGYTLIKAPVSGYIGRLPKKQGSLTGPRDASPLTKLSDVHNVRAYFSLGENDFINFNVQHPGENLTSKLKALAPVKLILSDQSEYSLTGRIDMVDGQFDQNTAAITLRASFPNTEGLLRSGNTGKIKMSVIHRNSIKVPISSTVELQDKVFVFTVGEHNKVSRQAITIIGKAGDDYIVRDGIKAGQIIVLSGVDRLQEGVIISPQTLANEKGITGQN
jgi:membrane fusion protein (multidrug efflux system)